VRTAVFKQTIYCRHFPSSCECFTFNALGYKQIKWTSSMILSKCLWVWHSLKQ